MTAAACRVATNYTVSREKTRHHTFVRIRAKYRLISFFFSEKFQRLFKVCRNF